MNPLPFVFTTLLTPRSPQKPQPKRVSFLPKMFKMHLRAAIARRRTISPEGRGSALHQFCMDPEPGVPEGQWQGGHV